MPINCSVNDSQRGGAKRGPPWNQGGGLRSAADPPLASDMIRTSISIVQARPATSSPVYEGGRCVPNANADGATAELGKAARTRSAVLIRATRSDAPRSRIGYAAAHSQSPRRLRRNCKPHLINAAFRRAQEGMKGSVQEPRRGGAMQPARASRGRGIGLVHQEPTICASMSVTENVLMGALPLADVVTAACVRHGGEPTTRATAVLEAA